MHSCFSEAVQAHGLPNRVRSDLGGENVDVWRYMAEQHSNIDSVLTGSSTHNQRIERLWRDVYRCVGVLCNTFSMLEEAGDLNSLNEVDLYCLHYVFLPRINNTLETFVESWNNHSLSSERNFTPYQLFIRGAIQQNLLPHHPNLLPQNSHNNHPAHDQRVSVPRMNFIQCQSLRATVVTRVNPLEHSTDIGSHLYLQTVEIVGRHLQTCGDCEFD